MQNQVRTLPRRPANRAVFVLQQNIYLCPGCCCLEDLSLVIPFPPVSLSFFLHWLLIHAFIHSFLQSTVSPPPTPASTAQCPGCSPYAAPSCVFLICLYHALPTQPCIAIPCPTTPPFPIHTMPILQCLALGLAMSPLIP